MDLPQEVWGFIVDHIAFGNTIPVATSLLFSLGPVCKLFDRLATTCLKKYFTFYSPHSNQVLVKCSPESLNFETHMEPVLSKLTNLKELRTAVPCPKSLTILTNLESLHTVDDLPKSLSLKCLGKLRSLGLPNVSYHSSLPTNTLVFENLTSLSSERLPKSDVEDILTLCPKLQSLSIPDFSYDIFSACTQFTTLHISSALSPSTLLLLTNLTDLRFTVDTENLPALQTLTGLRQLSLLATCDVLIEPLTNLETLELEGGTVSMKQFRDFTRLRSLVIRCERDDKDFDFVCLSRLTRILDDTNNFSHDIITKLPNLEHIEVLETDEVNDETFLHHSKLTSLSIFYSEQVTWKGISHLTQLTELDYKVFDGELTHFIHLTTLQNLTRLTHLWNSLEARSFFDLHFPHLRSIEYSSVQEYRWTKCYLPRT